MKKFDIYSTETVYYKHTIEAETMEQARLKAENEGNFNLGENDLSDSGSKPSWSIQFIEEVKE